jgi:hypothetical protein
MTNYDFACCDLKSAKYKNDRKKFKELQYGDKVYCIKLWDTESTLYEYTFKNAMMEGNSMENHKLRKGLFYLTDKEPYIGFKADIHKSGSTVVNINNKKQLYILVYATTLKETIERTEKTLGKTIDLMTLQHKIIN